MAAVRTSYCPIIDTLLYTPLNTLQGSIDMMITNYNNTRKTRPYQYQQ